MKSRRAKAGGALVAAIALALGVVALNGTAGASTNAAPAAAAAGTTAGCGKAPTLANGTRTINSGGQNRTYILRLPTNYDRNKPYRLIFGFHWLGGTANDVATGGSAGSVWAFYGQQQLSNGSAILVAPQGIDNGWGNNNNRDITLVDNLNALIQGDLCVDTSQIFATGWSYGGAMSYSVACARPTVFRAVAVLSGAQLSGCSPGNQPVAYLGIHGTHDSVLNISNGRSLRDTFVRNNGCTQQSPREPGLNTFSHIVTNYSNCRPGFPVTWIAFDGDHTPEPVDGTGQTSGARTWTGGEIWKFFSSLPSTISSSPPVSSPPVSSPPVSSPPVSSPPVSSPPVSVSPSVSITPSDTPGGCTASYQVTGSWQGGFQGEVTVNASSGGLNGWRVSWSFTNGQTITQLWGGKLTATGSSQTVANETWNGIVAAGTTAKFGFLANWNGTNSVPTVTCARA